MNEVHARACEMGVKRTIVFCYLWGSAEVETRLKRAASLRIIKKCMNKMVKTTLKHLHRQCK